MQIQLVNRGDPERVLVSVKNIEAVTLTTGMGVCLAVGNEDVAASADGVGAVLFTTSAELRPAFVGIAKRDIASNAYGPVIAWGWADSILLSQETDKTVGLLAGATLLMAGGLAGSFTSTLTPQAVSTYMGKYVVNAITTNISSALPYTSGLARCL